MLATFSTSLLLIPVDRKEFQEIFKKDSKPIELSLNADLINKFKDSNREIVSGKFHELSIGKP